MGPPFLNVPYLQVGEDILLRKRDVDSSSANDLQKGYFSHLAAVEKWDFFFESLNKKLLVCKGERTLLGQRLKVEEQQW
jgi:hypothetical protein